MNAEERLIESLKSRKPILFVGAGFSAGAICNGKEMPLGDTLNNEIYDFFYTNNCPKDISDEDKKSIKKYTLSEICRSIQREGRGKELIHFLVGRFKGTFPNPNDAYHYLLCDYYWDKIYTLNIDDLIENVYTQKGIKFVVQNERTQKAANGDRQIIKLHGCVYKPEEGFVFSNEDYATNTAIEDYRLKEFAQDFFANDVVFIGTEFNESDLSVLIERNSQSGFVSGGHNYYFVTPKLSYQLKMLIKSQKNFHHINWDAKTFLCECSKLKKSEKTIIETKRLLEQYGNFQDVEDFKAVPSEYESKLYYGNKVIYYDIFADWDIVFSKTDKIVKKILNLGENSKSFISIFGKAFCGKSVVATRLLIELYKNGYTSYSYNCAGEAELLELNNYLRSNRDLKKVAILIDDAAYLYGSIAKLINLLSNYPITIVFILVSNSIKHFSQKHELVGLSGWEWEVTGYFDDKLPYRVYNKLKEKNRLGKLMGLDVWQAVARIKEARQIVEFLYRNTFGDGFKTYFSNRASELVQKSSSETVELFNYLCVLSKMGIYNISRGLIGLRFRQINQEELSDVVIGIELPSNIMLRCSDAYDAYLFSMSSSKRICYVNDVLVSISNMFREGFNNRWQSVFEQLLKARDLIRVLKIDKEDVVKLFAKMEKYYSETSYYWLQRGLLKQYYSEYDEADTFLNQALNIRPNSYQIRHALAKNKLEKAVFLCGNKREKEADELYDDGAAELISLIENPWFSNNIGHSVHSYISMTLKFYEKQGYLIDRETILNMYKYLVLSSKQNYDKWMKSCRISLFEYCKQYSPEDAYMFDQEAFNAFKKENYIKPV